MMKILYYSIIKPLSLLPIPLLYRLSDCLYFILYYVVRYRKIVVSENIKRVFGDASILKRKQYEKAFYRHLADLIVESIKAFSISNKELKKRYKIVNPEILDIEFMNKNSIIMGAAHYGNWEWATMASSLYFKHLCVGIYTSFSNDFFERKMKETRGRNGLGLIDKTEVKKYFKDHSNKDPRLYFFLIDQSPSNPKNAFWLDFMDTPTAVQYGLEKYAYTYELPVYFVSVAKVKRGYYELTCHHVASPDYEMDKGKLLQDSYQYIESMIRNNPSYWLWSHRRWKWKKISN